MARIELSRLAQQDLREIQHYIAVKLSNETAAHGVVSKITKALRKLSDWPEIGTPLLDVGQEVSDYRFLVCGNYLAFYRATDNIVYIDRILYGRRDYINILFGNLSENE